MTSPPQHNLDLHGDKPTTSLYRAARDGRESAVKAILALAPDKQGFLNVAETTYGWTPLFIACVNGHLEIVKLLLEAGAEQRLCDLAGWTAKEHAVFRGHMAVAEFLVAHGSQDDRSSARSQILRDEAIRSGDRLCCTLEDQENIPSRLEPLKRLPSFNQINRQCNSILVTIGPSNIRSSLKPIELTQTLTDEENNISMNIKAVGSQSASSYRVDLPISGSTVNTPLLFTAEDIDKVHLVFEVFRSSPAFDTGIYVLGTGIALLRSLRQGLAPDHESLIRDFTIPVLEAGSMTYIGSVTFSCLVVKPFQIPRPRPTASLGFWKKDGPTQVVGHRGSGANSAKLMNLQIRENTVQSFLSATSLGASCVEFDVQLTKDYIPVISHDFLVMETGGDVPLHELTLDQFMHVNRSEAHNSELLNTSDRVNSKKEHLERFLRLKPRSYSMNACDDSHVRRLAERMRYTEHGIQSKVEGSTSRWPIQEPSTTLERLLTELPKSVPFNLEIKYPMLWEAEDRGMEYSAIEINHFVDTILTVIFRLCGDRNITLSSFSPEICILLACKQETFPILFINKAGSVPAGDKRAGSLQGAVEFAKYWGLKGIVMLSDVFVMCPRLLRYCKDSELVVGSYGDLNDDPDCALVGIFIP
ncbi:MAG: hypothetical protein Q9167_001171 [Letrouitia subvulpina]